MHAILGASDHCIAVHPSDMCVALAALDAQVVTGKARAHRSIPFADFHRLPGDHPDLDNHLRPGEMITAIELPPRGFAHHYAYLKVRDRTSFAFALVSVAAALEMDGTAIREARLALGGVAHKPWRSREAEELLEGKGSFLEFSKPKRRSSSSVKLAASATTISKLNWPGAQSFVRWTKPFKMDNAHDHLLHRTSTEPR